MPGLMAIREEFASAAAAAGRAHHRLAAHDDPDRGADRDAAGARRRGALGIVQHLLDAGPRRRRDRRRAARRCSRTRARRSTSTGTSRTASSSGRDGGCSQHDPRRRRRRDAAAASRQRRPRQDAGVIAQPGERRGRRALFAAIKAKLATRSELVLDAAGADQGRDRGDDDRREAPVPDGARKASSRSRRSTSTTR